MTYVLILGSVKKTQLICKFLLAIFFSLAATHVWAKTVDVVIDKSTQTMLVSIDGKPTYKWAVSTGDRNHETPEGTFKFNRMEEEHYSKEFDDAPMPNSIFFTLKGHAVHGSLDIKRLGRPVSHGCVRLHPDNAKLLYALVGEAGFPNTSVTVEPGINQVAPQYRYDQQRGQYQPYYQSRPPQNIVPNNPDGLPPGWTYGPPVRIPPPMIRFFYRNF
jgi:hypothetical protein